MKHVFYMSAILVHDTVRLQTTSPFTDNVINSK